MSSLRAQLLSRAPLLIGLVLLAVVGQWLRAAPPAASVEGVAAMLSAASGTSVGPRDFVWEPSRGVLADLILGRRVLFTGRASPASPRDLWRASVLLAPEGRPLHVARAVNLTSSPLGDVDPLVARGGYAAYAMNSLGAVQQITCLDLHGDQQVAPERFVDRVMAKLTNWQETDSFDGIARVEINTSQSLRSVNLDFGEQHLEVAPEGTQERFSLDLRTAEVIASPAADHVGASSLQLPHLAKPPVIWAVDTVRAWTGPEPIAWLEEQVFDLKDALRRFVYFQVPGGGDAATATLAAPAPPAPTAPRALSADGISEEIPWPPPPLRSMWKEPDPAEGKWEPVKHSFLQKPRVPGAKEQAPPYFYTTFVKPDPKRPYVKVLLVAMDSRQLQIGMEGGVEDPKPLTGARGEGRIPRDPAVLSRVVGAFNGAFKTTHGQYGMMVNRRVLLPPKPGAATVVALQDGRAGLGSWPSSDAIPAEVVSYRQNLEPLVEDMKVAPSGRVQWGFQLPGTSFLTHRSGLCLTNAGHLVYAWGGEVSAITLGNAMVQAGCVYGIHLDMNPHHTAFAFTDIRDPAKRDFDAKILTPEMETLPERFIVWSPKDFFYLMLRRFEPPEVKGAQFKADDGTQPPPAWAPAFFQSDWTESGVPVRVIAVAPGRARLRVRAGARSSDEASDDGLASSLDAVEARQVMAVVGLGNAPKGEARGLRVGGKTGAPAGDGALLVSRVDGSFALLPQGSRNVPADADFVELPAIMSAGRPLEGTAARSAMRKRGALCVSPDGFLWIATATASLDEPLAAALAKVGCELAVSTDRGVQEPALVARAGTSSPPLDRYEQTVAYLLGRPLMPGAVRWGSTAPTTAALAQ